MGVQEQLDYFLSLKQAELEKQETSKKKRQGVLANFQVQNGFSREEMAGYFKRLAEAKTYGFETIEDYENFLKQQNAPIPIQSDRNELNPPRTFVTSKTTHRKIETTRWPVEFNKRLRDKMAKN